MADLSKLGWGGDFNTIFFSGLMETPVGVSGNIIEISPPMNKKVRLTFLVLSTNSSQQGVSVIKDGVTVIDKLELTNAGGNSIGMFSVGGANTGNIQYIEAEDKIIVHSISATSFIIRYAFSYGE